MKLNKLVLTLTAATLLPAFAYAGTDPVATSFERDMYREPVNSSIAVSGEADPLVGIFNTALYGNGALHGATDQVLASFERDMYREPVHSAAAITGAADSLVSIFNVALRPETNAGDSKPIVQVSNRCNLLKGS